LAWIFYANSRANLISWIQPLSISLVLNAVRENRVLGFGSNKILIVFIIPIVYSIFVKSFRPLMVLFGASLLLFFTVPILASIKQPIITARYWTIGVPVIYVFFVFLYLYFFDTQSNHFLRLGSLTHIPGKIMLLLLTIGFTKSELNGSEQAKNFVEGKMIWKGRELVEPLVHHCRSGSISVIGPIYYYAFVTHADEKIFVDADEFPKQVISSDCPIIGWEEHAGRTLGPHFVRSDDLLKTASDQDLLNRLNITEPLDKVKVIRQKTGFIVLRRETTFPSELTDDRKN